MRGKKSKEKAQTLGPNDAAPNMIPFKIERPEHPTPEQINEIFNDLIKDLDYDASKIKQCAGFSTEDKLNVILNQEENEKKVPAPEWLIQAIDSNPSDKLLQTCSINLRTARLKWVKLFCQAGGHILLLKQLSMMTTHQDTFSKTFPTPHDRIMNLLSTLRFLVDCHQGSQHLLNFKQGLDIITAAIDPNKIDQFDSVLYVLIPYVFSEGGPEAVISSFTKYAQSTGQKHSFKIFSDVIKAHSSELQNTIILTFLNGLYSAVSSNYIKRMQLDFEFRDCALIRYLSELPPSIKASFSPWIDSFLSSIDADLKEVNSIFDGTPLLILKSSDVTKELSRSKETRSLLLSLYSFLRNSPQHFSRSSRYLARFLAALRSGIKCGDLNKAINRAHELALLVLDEKDDFDENENEVSETAGNSQNSENSQNPEEIKKRKDKLINLEPEVSTENSYYRLLHERFGYVADFDLPPVIEEEQIEKGKADKCEIATNELAALKAELAAVKEKNAKLEEERLKLMDLAQCLPSKPAAASEITISQIIPHHKADISVGLTSLSSIKSSIPAETYDIIEKVLTEAQAEQNATKRNAENLVRQLKDERDASKADASQILILQQALVSELKKSPALDSQSESHSQKSKKSKKSQKSQKSKESGSGSGSSSSSSSSESSDDDDGDDEFKFKTRDSRTDLVRRFGWREESESNASYFGNPEKNKMDNEEAGEMIEKFSVILSEGRVLSSESEKKYAHALKATKMDPKLLAEDIQNEKFSIPESTLIRLSKLPEVRAETIAAKTYTGEFTSLRDGEKLAVSLAQLSDWRKSVLSLIEHHRFDSSISVLTQRIEKFDNTLTLISQSQRLKDLLGFVLSTGNTLNGDFNSTFSLSDLSLLHSLKTNIEKSDSSDSNTKSENTITKKETLLTIIVERIKKERPELLIDLTTEMAKLQEAAKIDINQVEATLKGAQVTLARRNRSKLNIACSKRILEILQKVAEIKNKYLMISKALGTREELLKNGVLIPSIIDFYSDILKVGREEKAIAKEAQQKEVPQRGVLNSMVGALKSMDAGHGRAVYNAEADTETDYMKAFAKVRRKGK